MRTLIALLVLPLLLTACGFEVVDTGNRGIETRFGEVVGKPLPEGLHFYNPVTSDIREYEVRERTFGDKTNVFTKDTQSTDVQFSVRFYPDPKWVHTLWQEIGDEDALGEKVIKPVVLGSIKDSIGQIIADDLVSKREQATKAALETIKTNLKSRHILVTDLQFTNIDFDDAYERAVEEKVVAIQQAQKAKNETVRIEEEATQKVKTAQADAEAMKIKSQALSQNKGLVEYEMIQKWDGKMPTYMPSNSTSFFNLDRIKNDR